MKFEFYVNVHIHLHGSDGALLRGFRDLAEHVTKQGDLYMTTAREQAAELKQVVADVKAAVEPLPQAINDMEKKVTDALANGNVPADVQADVANSIAELRTTIGTIGTALADAADGVDEGATTTTDPATTGDASGPT